MGDTSGQNTELIRLRLSGTIGRREVLRRARAQGLGAAATAALLVLPAGAAARSEEEVTAPVPAPQSTCHDACFLERGRCNEGLTRCDFAFIDCIRECGTPAPIQPLPPKGPAEPEPVGPAT